MEIGHPQVGKLFRQRSSGRQGSAVVGCNQTGRRSRLTPIYFSDLGKTPTCRFLGDCERILVALACSCPPF